MTTWTEKRRLYLDWERAAEELWEKGYERQPCYNPNLPTLFTRNGETVFLVRLTPQAEWTVKVLEPLEQ